MGQIVSSFLPKVLQGVLYYLEVNFPDKVAHLTETRNVV